MQYRDGASETQRGTRYCSFSELFTVVNPFSLPPGHLVGIHFPASLAVKDGLWLSSGQWDLNGHDVHPIWLIKSQGIAESQDARSWVPKSPPGRLSAKHLIELHVHNLFMSLDSSSEI